MGATTNPPAVRALWTVQVMDLVELDALPHRMVGDLTTEQRKRLTIAVELVANPSVLFADEPTSGELFRTIW